MDLVRFQKLFFSAADRQTVRTVNGATFLVAVVIWSEILTCHERHETLAFVKGRLLSDSRNVLLAGIIK